MLYNIEHISNDILNHINIKEPFSLVRLGDGDLKLLTALVNERVNEKKFERSGIPYDKDKWLLSLYKNSCNNANYTSSFEMYGTKKFWVRPFSRGAKKLVNNWKSIYKKIGIDNDSFCNPEIGHLLFLNDINFLGQISDKKICLITCFPNVANKMKEKGYNIILIKIQPLNSNHYSKYRDVIKKIKKNISKVDIFLIGAGSLGKGYLNCIKNNGGVAIDIGQVMNVWNDYGIPDRFRKFLKYNKNTMLFELTNEAKKYRSYL